MSEFDENGQWRPPGHPLRVDDSVEREAALDEIRAQGENPDLANEFYVEELVKRGTLAPKPKPPSPGERVSELEAEIEKLKHESLHWQARHVEAVDAIKETKLEAEEKVERIKRDAELKVGAKIAELELESDFKRKIYEEQIESYEEQIEFYQGFFRKTLRRRVADLGHRFFDSVDAPR